MKKFNFLVFIVLGLFFTACNSEVNTKPKEVKFDREVCERCKMIISDRNYAVQVVNPQDGKSYYHDDIGCAILWFEESEISWKNEAIIYVADANSGKWIDAKKAFGLLEQQLLWILDLVHMNQNKMVKILNLPM